MFKVNATLLVVIIIPLLFKQIKSAQISNLISFDNQFIFVICTLDCAMTLFALFVLIEIIICFLDRSLVVMLNLSLLFWFELNITL